MNHSADDSDLVQCEEPPGGSARDGSSDRLGARDGSKLGIPVAGFQSFDDTAGPGCCTHSDGSLGSATTVPDVIRDRSEDRSKGRVDADDSVASMQAPSTSTDTARYLPKMQAPSTSTDTARYQRLLAIVEATSEELDSICAVIADHCECDICVVSLQREGGVAFVAGRGVPRTFVPYQSKEFSLYHLTASRRAPTIICDARADERFELNVPVVEPPHVRFYAAFSLFLPEPGSNLHVGTLYLMHSSSRDLPVAKRRQVEDGVSRIEAILEACLISGVQVGGKT